MRQFVAEHSEIDQLWFQNSNYICLLAVANEAQLIELCFKSEKLGLRFSKFFESDLNNALTAICIEPGQLTKKLLSSIKLAFRD